MDKARFLERAPLTYAVAIVDYLESKSGDAYDQDIRDRFSNFDDDGPQYELLADHAIFEAALKWLIQKDMISIVEDDFGPSIIQSNENFGKIFYQLKSDKNLPFFGYGRAQNQSWWLHHSLRKLAAMAQELGMGDEDYNRTGIEWSPIPLDRNDPLLQSVITNVDEVIEQIRGANGYPQTVPEERAYVWDGLTTLAERLKKAATISRPYVERYGLEPLRTLLSRFKDDATGMVVNVAIEALKQWLRSKGFPVS